MERLLYIGKSNKQFTHGKIYQVTGSYFEGTTDLEMKINLTIKDNKHISHYYNMNYAQYFVDNFKFITEEEYKQLIRKNKLNKISKL
jgi:hypothetical protein